MKTKLAETNRKNAHWSLFYVIQDPIDAQK